MRPLALVLLLIAASLAVAQDVRFMTVDVFLDADAPVAAWQFELSEPNAMMQVVGVENGESDAYVRAPYYDRDAVQTGVADRIIVADYSLASAVALPVGRFRIATLHLMLTGDESPEFNLDLVAAVTADGADIDAAISLGGSTGSEQ